MFLKKLTDEEKYEFMKHATLLAFSEAPALWGGKRLDELTSKDRHLSLDVSMRGAVFESLFKLKAECLPDESTDIYDFFEDVSFVDYDIKRAVEELPMHKADDSESRLIISEALQEAIFNGDEDDEEDEGLFASPSSAKLAVFELILLASSEGDISEVKMSLISNFAKKYSVEEFVVDDLLSQAREINSQVSRALSLILE